MKLVITIDTEEDNWARYSATDNPVKNIEQIVPLQKLFNQFKIKPTYLISYPVATNPRSISILKRILDEGKCEIGMHCHPWNTPPFDSKIIIDERDTMLCNLDKHIQQAKLTTLHETISKNFDITPVSFRAGRFGFSRTAATTLMKLGYRVDTSVTPFVSWVDYHGPDFTEFGPEPFRIISQVSGQKGTLLEIPVSVGFLQSKFELCRYWMKVFEKAIPRKLHVAGILERLGLLNKVWLSPEMCVTSKMIQLAQRIQKCKHSVLNMTFHSNSLVRGMSPFVQSKAQEVDFYKRIETFIKYAQEAEWESVTLNDFYETADCVKVEKLPLENIGPKPNIRDN